VHARIEAIRERFKGRVTPDTDAVVSSNTPPDMDIERINGIGNLLADLAARTEQLRGYL
jgi:hypothetical protein